MRLGIVARLGSAVVVLLVASTAASGATFYVRADGHDNNDGLANTAEGAWRTVNWAADHVAPGDVVRVQAGTYSERVTPGVSGTLQQPITFVADGAVTFCGMDISSRSYLRVVGFTIDTNAGACAKANRALDVSGINTGLEFWNNTIRDANYVGIGSGSYADRHHNFIVFGNKFTSIGGGGGNGSAVALRGNNSVLAYNDITGVDPDAFQVDGTYNRWLNNYIHNVLDTFDLHSDVFQSNSSSLGLSYNLFEGNFVVGAGNLPNEHGALIQNQSAVSCSTGSCGAVTENLFRRNIWHNTSGGVIGIDEATVGPITNTRQVHDTVVTPMQTAPTQTYAVSIRGLGSNAYFFNNIGYRAWGASAVTGIQVFVADTGATISGADYNLAFSPVTIPTFKAPWTLQAHPASNVNPLFVAYESRKFTLGAASAARGMAGPMTSARGSGTGTTFSVATGGGGFFRAPNANVKQYGGNLTAGDVITVGAKTLTVAAVSGDAITVTQSFSWVDGDPVVLGPTSTPDVGAYPYWTDNYSLSGSYSVASGAVTITPSDPRLVRFVVCYEDGVPVAIDNASPYTCSVGSGTVDVKLYPMYASETLFVTATNRSATPPANLRIVP
jgi:hypothetical protein